MGNAVNTEFMMGNQLPVSVTRWQHGSQISTFIKWKITKLLKTQEPRKPDKKWAQVWNPWNFKINLMYVWLNLKTIKFYTIKKAQISTDNQGIYGAKEPHYKTSVCIYEWAQPCKKKLKRFQLGFFFLLFDYFVAATFAKNCFYPEFCRLAHFPAIRKIKLFFFAAQTIDISLN